MTVFRMIATLLVPMALCTSAMAQHENLLLNLTKIQDGVKSKRVSSYDKSGGNNDRFEGID